MNPPLEFLIVLGFLIAISFLVMGIGRYTSCWNRLEKLYSSRSYNPTDDYGPQWINIASPFDPSGTFNRFTWVIKVGASKKGVFISGMGPLRLFFRPILLPWDELMIVKQSFIGLERRELILTTIPEIQFVLSSSLALRLDDTKSGLNRAIQSGEYGLDSLVDDLQEELVRKH